MNEVRNDFGGIPSDQWLIEDNVAASDLSERYEPREDLMNDALLAFGMVTEKAR